MTLRGLARLALTLFCMLAGVKWDGDDAGSKLFASLEEGVAREMNWA